jgi:hypothetical protein
MDDTTPPVDRAVALRPRRPGELLRAALDPYGRRPLALAAVAAVALVPAGILNWQVLCRADGCRITVLDGVVVSTSLRSTVAWALAPVAVLAVLAVVLVVSIRAVMAELAGPGPGRPGSLAQAVILVVGPVAALALASLPGMYLTRFDGPLPDLAVVADLLLVAAAGLYLGVRLAVGVPAAVVEGLRWPQALSRSWSLVGGRWGHAFATLFLAFVATGLVGSVVNLLVSVLAAPLVADGWLARTLVQAAVQALVLPYLVAVWVLLYLDLRARAGDSGLDTR